jgi:hypothetical protein
MGQLHRTHPVSGNSKDFIRYCGFSGTLGKTPNLNKIGVKNFGFPRS